MEPEVTSINHLPEEALAHVFRFVPGVILIHKFRFVSSSFNRGVRGWCSRSLRTVKLDEPLFVSHHRHSGRYIRFDSTTLEIFSRSWSHGYSSKFEWMGTFGRKRIGLQIRLLSLAFDDFEELSRLLNLTPNVTKLKIRTDCYKGDELSSLPVGFVLKKLKSLELISVDSSFPDKAIAPLTKSFMKEFGSQLKYLHFHKRGLYADSEMEMCLNAILESDVGIVTLYFPYNHSLDNSYMGSVNRLNSCVQDLSVSICPSMSVGMFENLARFIQNCRQLTKLTLTGYGRHKWDGSRLFKLHLMGNLTTLNLRMSNSINLFELVQPSKGPLLQEVKLSHFNSDVHPLFFQNFETVKILSLGNFTSEAKHVAKVFPNVSRLSVDLRKDSDFVDIGSLISELKCLTNLNLVLYSDHAVTLDLVGTTIIVSLQICQALQRLRVNVSQVQNLDTWAIFLAKLHYPLELTVINAELSDSCRELLKCRHQLTELTLNEHLKLKRFTVRTYE